MTNADKIRNMTDEDLAINMMCPNESGLANIDCNRDDNCNCYECLLAWLKQEATSKENNIKTLEDLEFSVRTYNCLRRAGIDTIDDLLRKTKDDLMRVRNLGRRSLDEVVNKMKALGYELKGE